MRAESGSSSEPLAEPPRRPPVRQLLDGAQQLAERRAAAVRAHLATCREPHPELAELGSVVPALAETPDPLEPAPSVRARILAEDPAAALPALVIAGRQTAAGRVSSNKTLTLTRG